MARKGRPVFTLSNSDRNVRSRSRSSDRGSDDEEPGLVATTIDIPPRIEETAASENEDSAPSERDWLLGSRIEHKDSYDSPTRRPYRLQTAYGAAANGHFLPLNSSSNLKRSESIFRLTGMIDQKGGDFEKYRKSDEELSEIKSRAVRKFYEEQNEILDGFAEVDDILDNTRALAQTGELAPMIPTNPRSEEQDSFSLKVKLAINVNFAINAALLAGKILAVVLSSSVSLLASTVDSAMDFLSTVIIFWSSKFVEHRDWKSTYLYPTGKQRHEPMGVTVFSVFMIASFLQVLVESVQRLLKKDLEMVEIPLQGIIIMLATIVIKGFVWVWCRSIRNTSVEALAQDAENDIVFNIFSLLFPYLGQKINWPYLDPLGGALLSIYIIIGWSMTLHENIGKLTGKRAPPKEHQRVAYLLTRFSPLIKAIQHLSVYHSGDRFIVEVDVILPRQTDLTTAHNVGESAQYGIEQMSGVERAFVHLDVDPNPLSGHMQR